MNGNRLLQASRQTIARGSKSFFAASLLLPPRIRASAHLLYAWCRHCDDCVDGQTLGFANESQSRAPAEVLRYLSEQTRRALAGESVEQVPFQALRRVVTQHEIPPAYPLEHLEGFAMDVRGETYDTLDDTIRYCYHVAGVVGVMMARIMGVRDRDTLKRAADLGIAFQLTNIARDVIDDAAADRVYLPREWLSGQGIDPEGIAHAGHRAPLSLVVGMLLDEADRYYASATVGIDRLPLRSAWAIGTALLVYRDIGRIVRKLGGRAWDKRVRVSPVRKFAWAMVAAVAAVRGVVTRDRVEQARSGLWPIPSLEAESTPRVRQRSDRAVP
jgi:phytoene synthase